MVSEAGRRDTYYGHKICLTNGASSLVLDCVILDGNPADCRPDHPHRRRAHRQPQADAEAVEDAEDELQAVKAALIEAGAEDVAEKPQTEMIGGEVRITAGGADLRSSSNSTVELIGSAIHEDSGRISLSITDDSLSRHGGAATKPYASPRSKHPNQITIRLNPEEISQLIVPGTFPLCQRSCRLGR